MGSDELGVFSRESIGEAYGSVLNGPLGHLPRGRIHADLTGAVDDVTDDDPLREERWGQGGLVGADGISGYFGHVALGMPWELNAVELEERWNDWLDDVSRRGLSLPHWPD